MAAGDGPDAEEDVGPLAVGVDFGGVLVGVAGERTADEGGRVEGNGEVFGEASAVEAIAADTVGFDDGRLEAVDAKGGWGG